MSIRIAFQHQFGTFSLGVDLTLPARGVTALYGPSGSGKTTVLRWVAGLLPAPGCLEVDGALWQNPQVCVPPHQRAIGYVFQDARLFPHLNVAENLDFGARRVGPEQLHAHACLERRAVIDLLGIGHLLQRSVTHLSGGEKQRVGIARALLTAPRLLLMDEPLAALDTARKREILPYLERLRRELQIPVLYVSHAADEVSRLADHLVLMEGGRVLGAGPLATMTARLDLPFARDEEGGVVLSVLVGAHDEEDQLTRLDFVGGEIWVARRSLQAGQEARLRILAKDVSIALTGDQESSILNRVPAVVVAMAEAELPGHVLVRLDARGAALVARVTRRSVTQLGLQIGQPVWAQIKSVSLLA